MFGVFVRKNYRYCQTDQKYASYCYTKSRRKGELEVPEIDKKRCKYSIGQK